MMGLRDYLSGFVKRRTPTPNQKEVYNLGIQEKRLLINLPSLEPVLLN